MSIHGNNLTIVQENMVIYRWEQDLFIDVISLKASNNKMKKSETVPVKINNHTQVYQYKISFDKHSSFLKKKSLDILALKNIFLISHNNCEQQKKVLTITVNKIESFDKYSQN